MKSLHRILSALCATTLCLFLPMTTACSMFGEKDSSSDSSSNTSTSSDSSSSADSSIEARHGHPGDFSDYFPDSMPDAVPYPIFPDQEREREGMDHAEMPAPPTVRPPRPVRPAHPGSPNGTDKMPAPRRPHKDGHPDSYQKDSGAGDKGSCSSDCSKDGKCSGSDCSNSSKMVHPRHGVRPRKNNRQSSN